MLVPAGVGERNGSVRFYGGPEQMLTGGASVLGSRAVTRSGGGESVKVEAFDVRVVDLAGWMLESFRPEDFVVLKLDVEGMEHLIIPRMVETGAMALVDILLWECHMIRGSKCWKLKRMVPLGARGGAARGGVGSAATRAAANGGVQAPCLLIYTDPYPWAPKKATPAWRPVDLA